MSKNEDSGVTLNIYPAGAKFGAPRLPHGLPALSQCKVLVPVQAQGPARQRQRTLDIWGPGARHPVKAK